MFFIQMSINVYFCHDYVFVSTKTLHIINILFFHEEWGFFLFLIFLSGVVSEWVLPDGVWSEWGYAQWGFVCLS